MENTTQSAKDFLTKYRDERTHPVSIDYFAEMMVAYAASVSPKLVMPSDTEIIERSFRIWPVAESDYHERIRARYREHFRADWLLCFDLVKELNPSLFK